MEAFMSFVVTDNGGGSEERWIRERLRNIDFKMDELEERKENEIIFDLALI